MLMQDNSTNKLQFASLLKFESHYPPLRGIVQLTNSVVPRTRNWSFTIIHEHTPYYGAETRKEAIKEIKYARVRIAIFRISKR